LLIPSSSNRFEGQSVMKGRSDSVRKPMTILAALAAAGSLGAVAAKAMAANKPTGCFTSVPRLSSDKTQVTGSGYCVMNDRRLPAKLTYSYTQADSFGNLCGAAISGRGKQFALKINGLFYVNTTFTTTSLVKVKGRYMHSAAKRVSLTVGDRDAACAKGDLTAGASPSPNTVCGYQFTNSNVCGKPMAGLKQPLPFWTGAPYLFDGVIYPPAFAEPSGFCQKAPDTRVPTDSWLGRSVPPSYWKCADGTMFYIAVYVHLYIGPPQGGGHECTTATAHPSGLRLDQLTLPKAWGPGHGDVEYEMVLVDSSGGKFYDSGSGGTHYANEYSDGIFRLDGNVDGCAQLAG
jgi:hypothetical protein